VSTIGISLGSCASPQVPNTAPVVSLPVGSTARPVQSAHHLPSLKVMNHSSQAQSNVPVTFGHTFRPGDVPRGTMVSAVTSSGLLPTVVSWSDSTWSLIGLPLLGSRGDPPAALIRD